MLDAMFLDSLLNPSILVTTLLKPLPSLDKTLVVFPPLKDMLFNALPALLPALAIFPIALYLAILAVHSASKP